MIGLPSAMLCIGLLAAVQDIPFAMPSDARIQTVAYTPDQVTQLRVGLGFATIVEFAPDEVVDSVVLGNSATWQVVTTGRGDRLVVKPLGGAVTTNMIVTTAARRYVFLLEPSQERGFALFVLRFAYPSTEASNLSSAPGATYSFTGNRTILPTAMSDDGRRTTIRWEADTALPAIFAVDERGKETLVNGRMYRGSYVVESVAVRYVFRLGKTRAIARRRPLQARP